MDGLVFAGAGYSDAVARRVGCGASAGDFGRRKSGDASELRCADALHRLGYGLPAMDGRGVKAASDLTGPPFDPNRGDRVYTPAELHKVRNLVAKRLPKLKDAPLVESRVCQYERTSDSNLIVDRHPEWKNVVLAGGGSGHGFKLGPAVGRLAASLTLNKTADPPPEVRVSRVLDSKRRT